MTNNEKFYVLINSCQHPREIYSAMLTFAEYCERTYGKSFAEIVRNGTDKQAQEE